MLTYSDGDGGLPVSVYDMSPAQIFCRYYMVHFVIIIPLPVNFYFYFSLGKP